jgi:hypothetical protein
MSRFLFSAGIKKSSPSFWGSQAQPARCAALVAAISKTIVEKLNDETQSSVGCANHRSSINDTSYGSGEPIDFTASHGERQCSCPDGRAQCAGASLLP